MGRQERKRRVLVGIFIAIAACGIVAYSNLQPASAPNTTPPATLPAATHSQKAAEALGQLAVKGKAPRTGYSRELFGGGWGSVNGCDTRNYILQRDLRDTVLEEDACTVLRGVLREDPYTGTVINFVRGATTSQAIQIDHIVAVSDAWQKGAQALTTEKRINLYNDPLNLLAVDGPTNNKKSDSDAASWLPPNKAYRCRYVARQIAVKLKYTLWVTDAERGAMQRVLGTCPDQVLPIVSNP